MSPLTEIETWLREDAQLQPGPASLSLLGGGVSCEVVKVEQGARTFVVKRALARLRVAADWRADVTRNATEHAFYEKLGDALSGSIPRVWFHNPRHHYFTMEFLGEGWSNWKELLLRGAMTPAHGGLAGALLGKLHATTWRDARFARAFDTVENFRQLRTDPYFRATAARRPEAAAALHALSDQIENARVCLVHGDFSPKNMLTASGHGPDRMMLLDAEVAWFGEPAFDIAFLQTHLLLKGLHLLPRPSPWRETAEAAWRAYREILGHRCDSDLETRASRLLAALLLARVDGKSPAEYLSEKHRAFARDFALAALANPHATLSAFWTAWEKSIAPLPQAQQAHP